MCHPICIWVIPFIFGSEMAHRLLCRFMFEFLAPLGLTHATCSTLMEQCGKAIAWLTADTHSFKTGNNIEKFMDAVTVYSTHT